MNATRIASSIAAIAAAAAASAFAPLGGGDLEIESYTIDGGGGTSTGGGYEVTGTLGQPDAGVMAGGDYALAGGFWGGGSPASPCPGDTDGNGAVDVDDLVSVILDWGTDGAAHNADVDGSGVVDVDDLVQIILGWGMCS